MNREETIEFLVQEFAPFLREVNVDMQSRPEDEAFGMMCLWLYIKGVERQSGQDPTIENRERLKRFFISDERSIMIGELQGENSIYMPSYLLQHWRDPSPPRCLLLKYGDCVIQADYKGILAWGVFQEFASTESSANVLEILSRWHTRLLDQDARDSFDVELLAQMKKTMRINDDTLELIIQTFPHLEHDAIHADFLRLNPSDCCRRLVDGDRERFRQRLMNAYDLSEEGDGPPLALVVLKSFLKSIEMSKYGRDGLLEEEDLRPLSEWVSELKKLDEVGFCRGRTDMLLFLLQNVKVEASVIARDHLLGSWRKILQIMTLGGESIQRKDWGHRQLPLHFLLSRGLPGRDILAKQDILEGDVKVDDVGTKCPVESLYPFQLAAIPNDCGVVNAPERDLSQVYELMRVDPSRVVESHHSLEFDREWVEALMKNSRESQILEQRKLKLKRLVAVEEEKITAEEQRLVEQCRQADQMPKYKKQRNY